MEQNDRVIQATTKHTTEMLEKLHTGEIVSEKECKHLISDLKELQQCSVEPETKKEEVRMITDIENQLGIFNTHADSSRQLLNDMLSAISEGRVPPKQQVQELDVSIEDLRQQYTLIYEIAQQQCSAEEMPEEGCPVAEYAEALKNSRAIVYRSKIAAAKVCLENFVAVKSLATMYAQPLSPYQQKAQIMLEKISVGEAVDISDVAEEAAGPEVFLKALESENPAVAENGNLIQKISQIYASSPMVWAGVAGKQYYVDLSAVGNDTQEITLKNLNSEEISAETDSEGNSAEEKQPALETEKNVSDSDASEEDIQKEESAFIKQLGSNNGFISPDDKLGELVIDTSPNEDKKISASIFTNDIRSLSIAAAKIIIGAVAGRQFITSHYLTSVKKLPDNVASASLEFLFKKGYLRKYSLTSGGMYFCESPRLVKALCYKEASKLVASPKRSAEEWGESIEDTANSAAARIALAEVYTAIAGHFAEADVKTYSDTISTCTEAFCMNMFTTGAHQDCELAVGAFWGDNKECDMVLESFQNMISNCEGIVSITFVGYTKRLAQVIADAIFSTLNLAEHKPLVYLYASSEHKFYAYPSLDEIKAADIHHTVGSSDAEEELVAPVESDDNVGSSGADDEGGKPDEDKTDTTKDSEEITIEKPADTAPESQVQVIVPAVHPVQTSIDLDATACMSNLYEIIQSGKYYAATAYAKACALTDPGFEGGYTQLAYALNDPMAHCNYSSDNVFALIANQSNYNDALIVATAIRTFFSNQIRYDYNIKSFYNAIKSYPLLDRFTALSKVVYTIVDFKDAQKKGMDAYADYHAKSKAELDESLKKICQDARDFYDSFIAARKTESASLKRFVETKRLLYSENGDIGTYVKVVRENDTEILALVQEFLQKYFFKDSNNLSEDTIDSEMLWSYICAFWEKAGDNMTCKRHMPLVSHLRTNIISTTTKAVQLLVRWCNITESLNSQAEDDGVIAYNKVRRPLLTDISDAFGEIENHLQGASVSQDEKAGLAVVYHALEEIKACIDGEYDEGSRKFFYAPFLLTNDVILDEQFNPDFDLHGATIDALQPQNRVLEHLTTLSQAHISYDGRMAEIMDEQGDDFGTASLIAEYLAYKDSSFDIKGVAAAISSSKGYAQETADLRKEDFIGELELAQSYGQIDSSVEDKKERILQIVNLWYDWAADCSNYGFFKKVLDCYLTEIKESAKSREHDLLEQLEKFQSVAIPNMTTTVKNKRIVAIRTMISKQNYTVAEDLLARAANLEEEHENTIEEDFLKDFLDNYDDYYRPVSLQRSSFTSLVSNRTRNKEERGAKKLADNWLPGGSNLGKDRLANLLTCFGFKVNSVATQTPIGKFENFHVSILPERNGQGISCSHPIAAFGSSAVQNGFRVVCINGTYDADGLINVMKQQIGNAKHTMVLLDCALTKSERRRLARKSKSELGDKLFAVVDRVVMMFLVRNYDATKINRMLISLITPFGYYQPYVWESANVMPPEIFMGRKRELERIKSATGVNIVYGGRQLGKSALLKKAKEDIDKDENGDRAVYVEIKGLTQEAACQKIGHELFDQQVLDEDIDTTDWNQLARAVKRRLQSTSNYIPYLLLLLDEADVFIDSCEAINYHPFDALKDIQGVGAGRFKFVIAGLRNIVRFKREAALGNNSVLTHLQPMTVKPFDTSEARELMEIPLHYLGLRFPAEKESLITLILATTNYFPGLIQMYCAKLLEAMRNKDYAGYDEVDTPIYEVSEEHIKKVLADPEFMQQIREKFFITLKLDEDNYYYLIALLLAYLYHSNGYNSGYSAADIKSAGTELEISKIAKLDDNKLLAFMEELQELNVLRKTDDEHFLFTRFTFFQMMGTTMDVDNSLVEFMGE